MSASAASAFAASPSGLTAGHPEKQHQTHHCTVTCCLLLLFFKILFMQWLMSVRMINDDAMKVHFGLRLLERTTDHAYCHNYPGLNQASELRHLQCWSSN